MPPPDDARTERRTQPARRPSPPSASAPATADIPLTVLQAPPSYPWADEFLLVRPDQHIAWRAADPADIDIEAAVGHGVDVPRRPHSAIA